MTFKSECDVQQKDHIPEGELSERVTISILGTLTRSLPQKCGDHGAAVHYSQRYSSMTSGRNLQMQQGT